jgi:hypothetical protein
MQNKSSQRSRRKYDASFKQEVVGMIAAGRLVPDIAALWAAVKTSFTAGAGRHWQHRIDRCTCNRSFPGKFAEHLALQKRL